MKGSTKFWLALFICVVAYLVFQYGSVVSAVQWKVVAITYAITSFAAFTADKSVDISPLGKWWNIFHLIASALGALNKFLDKHLGI